MQYFTEDYLWVVVIGIVIVMTFIGYIAEKTDFGRKQVEKAPKKEKKTKEKVKKDIKKADLKLNDAVYSNDVKKENNSTEVTEDLNVPINQAPVFEDPVGEDLTVPINQEEHPSIEDTDDNATSIFEEDLSASINSLEETKVAESVFNEEVSTLEPIVEEKTPTEETNDNNGSAFEEDLTVPISELETSKLEKTEKVTSNDDIWKF